MGKLKIFTAVALAAVIGAGVFYACQKDHLSETISKQTKSNEFFNELRQYLCDGLIIFKESLRPYYEQAGDYNEFCDLLDVNQDNMTATGKNLLQLGYKCLEREYSDEYIREYYTGKWMGQEISPITILLKYSTCDLFGVNYPNCENHPLGEDCYLMLRQIKDKINNAGIMEHLQGFCESLSYNMDFSNEEIIMSSFVSKILYATDIERIIFENETNCEVFFRDGEFCNLNIDESEKLVSLNFERNHYQLSFYEDRLVLNNLSNGSRTEYSEISDITENIDKAITISIAVLAYLQEIGHVNLEGLPQQPETSKTKNYWCSSFRRSKCTEEMMEKKMKDYCGGSPSYVGGTDCGCLWGNFYCICVTDFKC